MDNQSIQTSNSRFLNEIKKKSTRSEQFQNLIERSKKQWQNIWLIKGFIVSQTSDPEQKPEKNSDSQ
jgi:hypothetical protein